MKAFRLGRWGSTVLAPGNEQASLLFLQTLPYSPRLTSTKSAASKVAEQHGYGALPADVKRGKPIRAPDRAMPTQPPSIPELRRKRPRKSEMSKKTSELERLPSPPINTPSPKLAALHARLSLPPRFPIQTLAQCLVHETADPDNRFNNANFARLGNDLLAYYISEHLICHYPRLPMVVLTAAMNGFVGPASLTSVSEGWGVEIAAEPGGEVDPGLLQFRRHAATKRVKEEVVASLNIFGASSEEQLTKNMALGEARGRGKKAERAAKVIHNPFAKARDPLQEVAAMTLQDASKTFVRAVFGAIYLHCGAAATKEFFNAHILSRHLDLASLFTFSQPTRDLSRLCARENFESPVARLISETGRQSRHPVFIVGVFSGRDKLGEAAGASLNEARFKAAAMALKGWYLYSPKNSGTEVNVPSTMVGQKGKDLTWVPPHIDDGEIVA